VNGARADEATPVNAGELHAFLHCLSESVLLRKSGDGLAAEIYQMTASAAAIRAFPVGSPESRALGLILLAAKRVSEAAL
jgi:hypothetical protein